MLDFFLGSDPPGECMAPVEVPLPGDMGKEALSSSQRSLLSSAVWKSFSIPHSKAEVQEINIIAH